MRINPIIVGSLIRTAEKSNPSIRLVLLKEVSKQMHNDPDIEWMNKILKPENSRLANIDTEIKKLEAIL